MKFLKIENEGLLDIRLVSLMGGTTKTGSQHKIGQFGTGLKYVLAYLFRNMVCFKVFINGEEVVMKTEKEIIGGEDFNIICINGQRTSITTKMGLEWKAWMIVRELYSNALDEGEADYSIVDTTDGAVGKTCFYIELTPDFMAVYNNWNKYFIINNIPMFENKSFALHPSGDKLKLYKQGVLIYEGEEKSVFNYDLKFADINELREYKGTTSYDLYRCICQFDPKSIEYFLEHCTDEHVEGNMDYNWDFLGDGKFGNHWSETIGSAKIIHQEAVNDIKARGLSIDLSSTLTVPKKVYKALTKKFEGIGALRVAKSIGDFYEIHSEELTLKIKQCLAILENTGYFISPELSFIYGEFGDKSTLAKVDIDKKLVYISEKHLQKSLFDTCTMLIEENEHFQTGFQDCSRSFQQHFINLYTKAILDKAEIKI